MCCSSPLGSQALPWSMVSLPGITPLKKTDSLSQQLSSVKSPSASGGLSCPPLPSHDVILSGLSLFRYCVCCHSCCEFLCAVPCYVQKTLFPWRCPQPLALSVFLFIPLQEDSLNLSQRGVICWLCLMLSTPVSYSLHIWQSRSSVLIAIYCQKLLGWLRDALISGSSNKSLGDSLVLSLFSENIGSKFSLRAHNFLTLITLLDMDSMSWSNKIFYFEFIWFSCRSPHHFTFYSVSLLSCLVCSWWNPMVKEILLYVMLLLRDRVLLYCPGWTQTPEIKDSCQ